MPALPALISPADVPDPPWISSFSLIVTDESKQEIPALTALTLYAALPLPPVIDTLLFILLLIIVTSIYTFLFFRIKRKQSHKAMKVISVAEEINRRYIPQGVYKEFGKGEHWFLGRSLYWDDNCLDTTYFAYEALLAIDEITQKRICHNLLRRKGDLLRDFIISHFDEDLGGFRYADSGIGGYPSNYRRLPGI